jgi:hypothetical protein
MARHIAAGVAAIVTALIVAAGPAAADGVEESDRSRDLVLQAIALAVNTPDDVAAIREKVGDALEAPKKKGVALNFVRQADDALATGKVHKGRSLLERSIGARPHRGGGEPAPIREVGPPPKGAEPGRALPTDPLPGHSDFDASDWGVLLTSIAVALGGLALAVRYRPQHTGATR